MKLFKNQKGFNDTVVVAILGGIIGSIFIMTVFVWQEIEKANDMSYFYNKVSAIVIKNNNKVLEKPLEEKSGNIKFVSDELGISFEYPDRYGEVKINFSDYGDDASAAASGKLFRGTFSNEIDIVFGGTSLDFQAGRGGSITDSQGYTFENDKYYSRMPGLKKRIIAPISILDNNSNIILVINDDSFSDSFGISGWGLVPNTRAALINFESENEYAGMAIYNKNTKNISESEFEKMLMSFKFLDNNITIDYCESEDDCVPATCCHPTRVVNKNYAPDCAAVACTFSCEGPLDCGAGHPVCENNKCVIVEGRLE